VSQPYHRLRNSVCVSISVHCVRCTYIQTAEHMLEMMWSWSVLDLESTLKNVCRKVMHYSLVHPSLMYCNEASFVHNAIIFQHEVSNAVQFITYSCNTMIEVVLTYTDERMPQHNVLQFSLNFAYAHHSATAAAAV
jgi:hypothetical protein